MSQGFMYWSIDRMTAFLTLGHIAYNITGMYVALIMVKNINKIRNSLEVE